jgi:Lon-like protease
MVAPITSSARIVSESVESSETVDNITQDPMVPADDDVNAAAPDDTTGKPDAMSLEDASVRLPAAPAHPRPNAVLPKGKRWAWDPSAVRPLSPKHRRWAFPLVGLGALILVAIVVSSFILVPSWSEAPGSAGIPQIAAPAVASYPSKGHVLFVTVSSGQLNGLAAVQAWIDPDVDQQNRKERFGDNTPEQDRQQGLAQMRTARDDAPYVALTKLGYPTELIEGPVVIDQLVCVEASPDRRKCVKFLQPGDFLHRGDEINAIDGHPVHNRDDLDAVMKAAAHKPGDVVHVDVHRVDKNTGLPGKEQASGDVTLVEDPGNKGRAILGINSLVDTTRVVLPFPVNIPTGEIGGPSAGLAFTLSVLDALTPGELTGGHKVAVTGTIDVDGNVGAIGGIRQKAVAVQHAGAQYFVIPTSQSPEEIASVQRIFGASRVFTVSTLDEALAVLAKLGGNALDLGQPGKGYAPAAQSPSGSTIPTFDTADVPPTTS